MKVIRQFPLGLRPFGLIEMPQGAEILSCGWQGTDAMLWVLLDENNPRVRRRIAILPTEQNCHFPEDPTAYSFIGRIEPPNTGMVLHAFDFGEKPITGPSTGSDEL